MTAGNSGRPFGHQRPDPNNIENCGSDSEEEEEELEDDSPIPTPPPSPGHLRRIADLRRQNQEMEEELERNRRQLWDVEEIARHMRDHTSRIEQEVVRLRNLRASRGREFTNEQVEMEAEAAEPQNEDESGDEPGKREVEGAVDEASTKDGEGSSTP